MIQRLCVSNDSTEFDCALPPSNSPDQVALERLAESPYSSLRQLHCEFHEGVLTLRGRLPTFFMMQIAQTIVAGVDGVELVSSHIEVPYVSGNRFD